MSSVPSFNSVASAAPFEPSGNYDTVVKTPIQKTIDEAVRNGIQSSDIDKVIDKTGANPIVTLYVKYKVDENGELKIDGKFHVGKDATSGKEIVSKIN